MIAKELIEALQQCHPDAQVSFSINFDSEEETVVAVEYEIMWRKERGDKEHPGKVLLHNDKTHFFNEDGTVVEGNFILS